VFFDSVDRFNFSHSFCVAGCVVFLCSKFLDLIPQLFQTRTPSTAKHVCDSLFIGRQRLPAGMCQRQPGAFSFLGERDGHKCFDLGGLGLEAVNQFLVRNDFLYARRRHAMISSKSFLAPAIAPIHRSAVA
jgi:hypothetical protein